MITLPYKSARLFPITRNAIYPVSIVLVFLCSVLSYVQWTWMPFLLGLGAAAAAANPKPSHSRRYGIAAALMLCIAFFVPVKTFLYFGLIFSTCYWIESKYASIGCLGFVALLVSCPVFEYGITAFSFPIRLQLTALTGKLLSAVQPDYAVQGNIITNHGFAFSVDPACMGLNMFSVSLLMGILFAGILQRKLQRRLSIALSIALLLAIVVLNLAANVIRIMVLVQFRIGPDNFLHELIGLVCLLLYILYPVAVLSKKMILKFGRLQPGGRKNPLKTSFPHYVLLLAGVAAACCIKTSDTYSGFSDLSTRQVKGYSATIFMPGVLKLENEKALVYVKYIRGFYDTEHHPSMCWKGSGYAFENVEEKSINGVDVFAARLSKGNDQLYTAWFYFNGTHFRLGQWAWRLDMLRGAPPYALVNLTAASESAVQAEMEKMLKEESFRALFNHDVKRSAPQEAKPKPKGGNNPFTRFWSWLLQLFVP